MKPNIFLLLSILFIPFLLCGESHTSFTVKKIGTLPVSYSNEINPGIAGAFSGISGDKLIVAGGANFPDKKPWEGGLKIFCNRIYIYRINADSLHLIDQNWTLPNEVAYGASVTLPEGVLAIGGNNMEECFNSVRLLKWDIEKNNLVIKDFPSLPVPLSYVSAVLLDNSVYVVGGSSSPDSKDTGKYFFKLDLSKQGRVEFIWETLPVFPGAGRIFMVAASQANRVFLFGGRNISKQNEVTVFNDGLVYDPKLKEWESIPMVGNTQFQFMAGAAFTSGKSEIVFVGGVSADLFYQEVKFKKKLKEAIGLRDSSAIAAAQTALLNYYTSHPGFSNKILTYNIKTKALVQVGKFDGYCPVTVNAIPYHRGAIIASGEIKPGTRTPDIIFIKADDSEDVLNGRFIIEIVGVLAAFATIIIRVKRQRIKLKSVAKII